LSSGDSDSLSSLESSSLESSSLESLPDSVAGKATTTSDGIDVIDELLDRRRFGSDVVVAPEPESSESSESSSSVVGGATG
jgi:hypothetical protein